MNPTEPEPVRSISFEQALGELEAIVRDLEAGDISLEAALSRYEAGVGLLKNCYAQLRQAEQKVLLLAGEDADGRPVTQPFDATSASNDSPRRARKTDTSY